MSSLNWPAIRAIVWRDLTVVTRARAVTLPIVIVPLVFFVVMPAALVLGISAGSDQLGEIEPLLAMLPAALRAQLGETIEQQVIAFVLEYQFATLFLIVPLLVAAVIAADSFAGEKERKTLEALLYTPTTDFELYLAKLLGPWIAAIIVGLFGFTLLAVTANLLAGPMMGRPVVLTALWLVNLVWLMPAVAAFGLVVLVQVSARVRGFQEAYQLGGLVVLPLLLLIIGQLAGVLLLDVVAVVILGAVVWLVAAAGLWLGFRSFRRERLLVSL